MQIKLNSNNLDRALKLAGKVISPKPGVPSQGCYLITAKTSELTVVASNYDTRISISVECMECTEEGQICIPAKSFANLISLLPDMEITLSTRLTDAKTDSLHIEWSRGFKDESLVDANTYPDFATAKSDVRIEVNAQDLKSAIEKTAPFTDIAGNRPVFQGVHFDFSENAVTTVGTDAHFLRTTSLPAKGGTSEKFTVYTPTALLIKASITKDIQTVYVTADEKNATFNLGDVTVDLKTIQAKYPNYRLVMPPESSQTKCLCINKEELMQTLRRLSGCADNVIMTTGDLLTTFEANSYQSGSRMKESCACQYSGESISISFKAEKMLTVLASMDSEQVKILMSEPSKALLIKNENSDTKTEDTALLMPIKRE